MTPETGDSDRFVNFYRCPKCGHHWEDVWSCQVEDDCPYCGERHVEPYKSDDATPALMINAKKRKSWMNYEYHEPHQAGAVPIKAWTKGVPVEESAMEQVRNIASLPFIHKHVALMPDVHQGMGATIGSVIPTKNAIIPAAVGVDIGCGMMALRTSLTANDLPDNLNAVRSAIEAAVPHGRTDNGGVNDRGAWGDVPHLAVTAFLGIKRELDRIVELHPKIMKAAARAANHLGTLGTGNHFIELCLDEGDRLWIMLHSGSRGIGNRIGSHFIELAKQEMRRWHVNLPDANLAYLPDGTDYFNDYVNAVGWAQAYAAINRNVMMRSTIDAVERILRPFHYEDVAINCHHNYVQMENHFGENVWVTRKGAVRAREGDLGIIPGAMGRASFIVRGKGDKHSFCSCSHGAGRVMSRTEAKKRFSVDDHNKAIGSLEARRDADVIDETPAAYKNVHDVMAAQSDLVDIVHTLRAVVCVKG